MYNINQSSYSTSSCLCYWCPGFDYSMRKVIRGLSKYFKLEKNYSSYNEYMLIPS